MRADELMIGDWVLLAGVPVKIWSINLYEGDDPMGGHHYVISAPQLAYTNSWVDILNPIPLTAEILEKHAEKGPDGIGYTFGRSNENSLNILTDSRGEFRIMEGDWEYYGLRLTYVHELQHALRLCGIEKEIIF